MIDLSDEKQKYYYLGKCISGKPLDFYTEKIFQPTVDEIFDMGEENYTSLLTPFILSNDILNIPSDIDLLDVYMMDEYLYRTFLNSLCYFMKIKSEDIKKYNSKKNIKLIIKDTLIIDNNKLKELKILVQLMCNVKEISKEDIEKEEDYKFKDEESRRKVEQYLKEKKKALKNKSKTDKKVKLVNVYDYIVHAQEGVDYNMPLKWSIYQMYNSYQNLHKKENISFMYDIASNGMLSSKEKLKSLSEEIAK